MDNQNSCDRLQEVQGDVRLNECAKRCYELIARTLEAFPNHDWASKRIATEVGFNRNTVQVSINKLISLGYLLRTKLSNGRTRYRLGESSMGIKEAKESLYSAFGPVAFRCDQATMGDVFKNIEARYPELTRLEISKLIETFSNDCREAEINTSMTVLTEWLHVALPVYVNNLTKKKLSNI